MSELTKEALINLRPTDKQVTAWKEGVRVNAQELQMACDMALRSITQPARVEEDVYVVPKAELNPLRFIIATMLDPMTGEEYHKQQQREALEILDKIYGRMPLPPAPKVEEKP